MDNDIETMLRLQGGEDNALNELMSRWQQPLVNFIFRYLGNANDALDLAQDTFVRIFEKRERYRPTGKFSTWLFAIAANLCRNHIGWRRRHPTVSLHRDKDTESPRELVESIPSPAKSPAENVIVSELASAVKNLIQELPHDLRTAILLFEYEDMSYEQIAVILGCSVKAVETRLYRARNILRRRIVGGTHESS
uniref:RNA polymerase sigma factor n=1 Tax=uncultured Acidobacteria bacterium A11 TaxID=1036854 RepID=F8TTK1_9BACT|nr:RNA polymerase sigma factor [uncultured Acidobacteria bacterium A11]